MVYLCPQLRRDLQSERTLSGEKFKMVLCWCLKSVKCADIKCKCVKMVWSAMWIRRDLRNLRNISGLAFHIGVCKRSIDDQEHEKTNMILQPWLVQNLDSTVLPCTILKLKKFLNNLFFCLTYNLSEAYYLQLALLLGHYTTYVL